MSKKRTPLLSSALYSYRHFGLSLMACKRKTSSREEYEKPLSVGVFGGSFNPIHLGHVLLAISAQQTDAVDEVVLVPVFKHVIKRDLLPFEERVKMCKLAVAPFGGESSSSSSSISVSTIEQQVGESNGAMLRALKKQYPVGTRFQWICGDDFFAWMETPKGIETLQEVSGLIVKRRLYDSKNDGEFLNQPIDEKRIRSFLSKMNVEVDFVCEESLAHLSSTLVRRAPKTWRSFLSQSVTGYLDTRPHLRKLLFAKGIPRNNKRVMLNSKRTSCLLVEKGSTFIKTAHALRRNCRCIACRPSSASTADANLDVRIV